MINIVSASQARANIHSLINQTAQTHEPILVRGKENNVVMISQEDWEMIEETLYLNSIPNLSKSIQDAMQLDDSEFSETVEW